MFVHRLLTEHISTESHPQLTCVRFVMFKGTQRLLVHYDCKTRHEVRRWIKPETLLPCSTCSFIDLDDLWQEMTLS